MIRLHVVFRLTGASMDSFEGGAPDGTGALSSDVPGRVLLDGMVEVVSNVVTFGPLCGLFTIRLVTRSRCDYDGFNLL